MTDIAQIVLDAPTYQELAELAGKLADTVKDLLVNSYSGDDVRLLAVVSFGSNITPSLYEKCDRVNVAQDKARKVLQGLEEKQS